MNKLLTGIGLALTMALLHPAPVVAKESAGSTATRTRKMKAPKVPTNPSYGETRKERDQRLLRECKGRPNAGACEGYAS